MTAIGYKSLYLRISSTKSGPGEATGFLGFGEQHVYLVSNRHVFDKALTIDIEFRDRSTQAAFWLVESLRDKSAHPRYLTPARLDVDLAAIPLDLSHFPYDVERYRIAIPKNEPTISIGDEIVVAGFKPGLRRLSPSPREEIGRVLAESLVSNNSKSTPTPSKACLVHRRIA